MATSRLDRQRIQRRDFPRVRRGYDPDVVDAHLAAIAADVAALAAGAPPHRAPASLAEDAAERVQEIVVSADRTAQADRVAAAELSAEARRDAERIRGEAIEQARQFLGAIADRSTAVRARLRELEHAMESLAESQRLRTGALDATVSKLERRVVVLGAATGAAPGEPAAQSPEVEEDPATQDAAEAARLVILNMALEGQSREEIDQYLTEHFELPDRERLIEETYVQAGGER